MVTCWERANLLALLCVMLCCVFVKFPRVVLGQVWYLIVSIPDLYLLTFFNMCVYVLASLLGAIVWSVIVAIPCHSHDTSLLTFSMIKTTGKIKNGY